MTAIHVEANTTTGVTHYISFKPTTQVAGTTSVLSFNFPMPMTRNGAGLPALIWLLRDY